MLGKIYFILLLGSVFITGCGVDEVSSIGTGIDEVAPIETTETVSDNTRAVRIAWSRPSTYESGAPLNDLTGYKIYYNTSIDRVFLNDVVVNQSGITAYTLYNLQPGSSLYVVITAVNSKNVESQISEIVNIVVPS